MASAKPGKLATIGSQQVEAWQIISGMVEEQGWHLLDIRADRNSYWAKWTERSLRQQFGHRYHPVPELVNLHELEPDLPVALVDPAAGLAKVGTWLEAGLHCLLLCRCHTWQHCHRRQVAALLQQAYPTLEVTHLVCDRCSIELPVVLAKTVELFQQYGLLVPVPCVPGEQPVLVRTTASQRVTLPDLGPCTLKLSVTLWPAIPLHYQDESEPAVPLSGSQEEQRS
jgi:hypothetical protein